MTEILLQLTFHLTISKTSSHVSICSCAGFFSMVALWSTVQVCQTYLTRIHLIDISAFLIFFLLTPILQGLFIGLSGGMALCLGAPLCITSDISQFTHIDTEYIFFFYWSRNFCKDFYNSACEITWAQAAYFKFPTDYGFWTVTAHSYLLVK